MEQDVLSLRDDVFKWLESHRGNVWALAAYQIIRHQEQVIERIRATQLELAAVNTMEAAIAQADGESRCSS